MLRFTALKEKIKPLITSHNSPSEIALGVAIGVFICILPLYGFHMLLFVISAFLVRRANKVAMFIGTSFSLPVTVPFITWAGYETGRYFLPNRYPPFSFGYFRHFNFKHIGDFYFPLFIGSLIFGLICAVVFYVITYVGVLAYYRRKKSGTSFNFERFI